LSQVTPPTNQTPNNNVANQTLATVTWQENKSTKTAHWHSEAHLPPPKKVILANDETKADDAYKQACEGTALLYKGDFQNAKQLLQAITRRVDRKPIKPTDNMLEAFHQHRARQIQRANITNKVLIELTHGHCELNRAPSTQEAVQGAIGEKLPSKLVVSLRELLGMIGANEWRKKGVYIDALQNTVHAHYGVYSPVRGEYLALINQAPLNNPTVAWDIGTGTGVIAAILVARGVKQVIATDTSARALQCASENIAQLSMQANITLQQANMFPQNTSQKPDLIVCNPPWLPAKANAPIEFAIYDPNNQMLKAFLIGVKQHLSQKGEAWLVMSNLAELIGLRQAHELTQWIADAGLTVLDKTDITPKHAKATDQSDPLYRARAKEITSLYRLQ
jgi:methylase of polypeptide subunit release factors